MEWFPRIPCGWCGEHVRETESGRGRRWCSDACRLKSYRAHKRLERFDAGGSYKVSADYTIVPAQ